VKPGETTPTDTKPRERKIMAVNTTPAHAAAAASHSAAGAVGGLRNARPRLAADADDDGGFAAQLMRAQPQPAKPDAPESRADKSDKDDEKDDKDARPADGTPLFPWASLLPQAAPATAALASGGAADAADAAGGLMAGLKKGVRSGKDAAADALAAGKDAKSDAAALAGKSATDATAALGKDGAANVASETRDSMAALLPQADVATVQAGAIGASPNAVLDYKASAEQAAAAAPAQAALPMAPQSPAFAPALGQQIALWMRDGVQHAEVQLSPQDLGPIRVKIAVEGAATRVEMSADVASTRDALQQALPQLSDSLGQVGLSLSGGGVSDQPANPSPGQFQADADTSGRGGGGDRTGETRGTAADAATDFGAATAARQAAQRRGLLDMYA
jgi:flagellar hook-length control protein FliK